MLVTAWQKLNLGKLLAIFVAGVALCLNVACSNGTEVGARPNNLPVQMGGQNNPYKGGGDGYTDYQMSSDPAVKAQQNRSSLPMELLVAANNTATRASDSDFNAVKARAKATDKVKQGANNRLMNAKQTAEPKQAVIDRSDPNEKILEKSIDAFKEASKHLTGSTDKSLE